MRRLRRLGVLLFGLTVLEWPADAARATGWPARFDLVCRGRFTDIHQPPRPFQTRLRVDLEGRRFCIDDCASAWPLTKSEGAGLRYAYDLMKADADRPAGRYRGYDTSAGPFALKDEIVVDRASGAFRREYRYDHGDPAAVAHHRVFVGRCAVAPFTPLPPGR